MNATDIRYIPISLKEEDMQPYLESAFAQDIYKMFVQLYGEKGFEDPWIGYFAVADGTVIGVGGYKGPPVDGRIEIAYATVPEYEGRGIASRTCRFLTETACDAEGQVRVTARTLREENASTSILKKNGYTFVGVVDDPEDGLVSEWEYAKEQQ